MKRFILVLFNALLTIILYCQASMTVCATGSPTITCKSIECSVGDTITMDVEIGNNPGIMYLELTPVYSEELGSPTITNGEIFSDLTAGKQLVWTAENDMHTNGKLASLSFTIDESTALGNYTVGFVFRSAYNYDEDSFAFEVIPATIIVKEKIKYGDVDNNGQVNSADRTLLSRYLAGWNLTEEETQYISLADINTDGKVSQIDRMILSRYLAGWYEYDRYFE